MDQSPQQSPSLIRDLNSQRVDGKKLIKPNTMRGFRFQRVENRTTGKMETFIVPNSYGNTKEAFVDTMANYLLIQKVPSIQFRRHFND